MDVIINDIPTYPFKDVEIVSDKITDESRRE